VAAAQSGQVAAPPSGLSPADRAVLDVAIRAMDPDPSKRFASAAAMSSELATAAGGGPAQAGAGGDATRAMPAQGPLATTTLYASGTSPRTGGGLAARMSAALSDRQWRVGLVGAAVLVVLILALVLGLGSGPATPSGRTTAPTRPAATGSTTTTAPTPATALANLVRDATAGETAGSVDHASAQTIINQAQQAVTDSASGRSSQAANDLQQVATVIANGLQNGSITQSEAGLLQSDLVALADLLGLGAAATPPTTAAPGPGPGPGHGGGKPGKGNG